MRMSEAKLDAELEKFCDEATVIIDMKQIWCIKSQPQEFSWKNETDEKIILVLQGQGYEHTIRVHAEHALKITHEWFRSRKTPRGVYLFTRNDGDVSLVDFS